MRSWNKGHWSLENLTMEKTMNHVIKATQIKLENAPDVTLSVIKNIPGEKQIVAMKVIPGGTLPMHSHAYGADMHVTSGVCVVMTPEGDFRNGTVLKAGDGIRFEAGEAHGYLSDVDEGFESVSINDGILDASGNHDIKWEC